MAKSKFNNNENSKQPRSPNAEATRTHYSFTIMFNTVYEVFFVVVVHYGKTSPLRSVQTLFRRLVVCPNETLHTCIEACEKCLFHLTVYDCKYASALLFKVALFCKAVNTLYTGTTPLYSNMLPDCSLSSSLCFCVQAKHFCLLTACLLHSVMLHFFSISITLKLLPSQSISAHTCLSQFSVISQAITCGFLLSAGNPRPFQS